MKNGFYVNDVALTGMRTFSGNARVAFRQAASLFQPRNWYQRFADRTPLGQAFSLVRYGSVVGYGGLTVLQAAQNNPDSASAALSSFLCTTGLVAIFSAQRISGIRTVPESNPDGSVSADGMDRVNVLDALYCATFAAVAFLHENPGYGAMALTFGLLSATMASIPNSEEYQRIRDSIAKTFIRGGYVAVGATAGVAAYQEHSFTRFIMEGLPALPMTLGILAGSKLGSNANVGRGLHYLANLTNLAVSLASGLYIASVSTFAGGGNWAQTIGYKDAPIRTKDGRELTGREQWQVYLSLLRDPNKREDYIFPETDEPAPAQG